jgi:hypothetical protein
MRNNTLRPPKMIQPYCTKGWRLLWQAVILLALVALGILVGAAGGI